MLHSPCTERDESTRLQNSVAVVTGASSGLGYALTQHLAKAGCHVVATAPDTEEIERSAREAGALGVMADVSKSEQLDRVARITVEKFGRLDLWVNNAGIRIPQMPVAETDVDRVHRMMEVNFFGVFNGCRAALTYMRSQQNGTIVNILSSAALAPKPHSAGYAASKAAAASLTQSLRQEVGTDGIRVIGVYPGGMKTRLFDEQVPPDYHRHMGPSYVAEIIIENLQQDEPIDEQVILNPDQLKPGAPRLLALSNLPAYRIHP